MSTAALFERDDDPDYGAFQVVDDGHILLGPDVIHMGTVHLDNENMITAFEWTPGATEEHQRQRWMAWTVTGIAEVRRERSR